MCPPLDLSLLAVGMRTLCKARTDAPQVCGQTSLKPWCRGRERGGQMVRPNTSKARLVAHSLVGDLQPSVDDGKCLSQLLLVNAKRWVGEESIPADEGVKALLAEEASQRSHLF